MALVGIIFDVFPVVLPFIVRVNESKCDPTSLIKSGHDARDLSLVYTVFK